MPFRRNGVGEPRHSSNNNREAHLLRKRPAGSSSELICPAFKLCFICGQTAREFSATDVTLVKHGLGIEPLSEGCVFLNAAFDTAALPPHSLGALVLQTLRSRIYRPSSQKEWSDWKKAGNLDHPIDLFRSGSLQIHPVETSSNNTSPVVLKRLLNYEPLTVADCGTGFPFLRQKPAHISNSVASAE